MADGSDPTDRGKLGTKRHNLTDTKGIPLSVVISPANTHDIKPSTGVMVMDSVVVKQVSALTKLNLSRKRKLQHLCLGKA
jgi:IS5 family transposase